MTAPNQKTVNVLSGFTGPTGTFEFVNIIPNITGASGEIDKWLSLTGASGGASPKGTFKSVINIGPTGPNPSKFKTATILGFSSGGAFSTFDPATVVNGTLSNGNDTFTHAATTTQDGARTTTARTTGKLYFEMTLTNNQAGGGNTGISLGDPAATYANQGSGLGAHGITEYLNSGDVWAGAVNVGNANGGQRSPASGDVIGVSIDIDNKQVWFQNITTGGTRQGPFTPVTETSYQGMIISNTSGGVYTINVGATAFVGTIPATFSAWG